MADSNGNVAVVMCNVYKLIQSNEVINLVLPPSNTLKCVIILQKINSKMHLDALTFLKYLIIVHQVFGNLSKTLRFYPPIKMEKIWPHLNKFTCNQLNTTATHKI